MTQNARMPKWAKPLFQSNRYKVLYGGRGSGKSHAIAQALVLLAAQKPLRIACIREFQKSIEESSKRVLEHYINELGLRSRFTITKYEITGANGSHFFFRGLSTATEEAIRGLEAVDKAWVEEAHRTSQRSMEILLPTIRKPGSELWFSFNPASRSDPVWQMFCTGGARTENAFILKVNYNNNPFFPEELEEERQACLRDDPERYAHIWQGEPDDEGELPKVLPYFLAQICVDAWGRRSEEGHCYVGLDVADSDAGGDKNAVAVRKGASIVHVEDWSSSDQGATTRRSLSLCREHDAAALYYDRQGVGAGVKTFLKEQTSLPCPTRPIGFGDKVKSPERRFTTGSSNEQFFSRRNAQLAWALRMRALRTKRLMAGEDIPPENCLFINPETPRLERYLTQLSQPVRDEDIAGRVKIDKRPDDLPSPDLYDASALAFARDSDHGLIQK